MPHKLHNTIRLGRTSRLAALDLKRVQKAAWIGVFATMGMIIFAIGAFH